MPHTLNLEVVENGRTAFTARVEGPVELGRQRSGEPEPYVLLAAPGGAARLLVARQPEGNVSRQHALLEATASGAVRVANVSRVPLEFDSGPSVAPDSAAERTPPFTLRLAGRDVRVERGDSVDSYGLRSLDARTVGPGDLGPVPAAGGDPSAGPRLSAGPPPAVGGHGLDALLGWLQTTLGVLQSTIASVQFLDRAVEAMVSIVGLDSGRALRFEDDGYEVLAACPATAEADWQPSRRVLDRVRHERRTVWQEPSPAAVAEALSLRLVQTVVAAPLLHPDGRVVGVLYGERRIGAGRPPRPVGKLEALLVDVLACGVATGLARQEQERAALSAQVRFEQFFTPDLARHLAREPNLLEGREAEVTLLFCDVRGFSRISERVGPAGTVRWIGAVMDELSRLVLDEGGVLVDYIADELVAMWGAPAPQPDHAERAARAARAFCAAVPGLNERWGPTVGEAMDLGVGLNSGVAQVGNTGSRFKFKYGPLGNTVNLASRVQGLTKYLKCRLLVTAATRSRLGPAFAARRVCRARVVNIAEPVDLYEVEATGDRRQADFFLESEAALTALEGRDFAGAALAAGALLQRHPGDGPLRLTLARASAMLVNDEAPFDPVWVPPGK
jgi:adenylate cyclase